MSSSRLLSRPEWRTLYRAAVIELDNRVLLRRIETARAAIHARIVELDASHTSAEALQLENALSALKALRQMCMRKAH
jgi:hypothetical protein